MRSPLGWTDIDQQSGVPAVKTKAWLALLAMLCGLALPISLNAANFLFSWKASTDPSVTAYGIYQRTGDSAYVKIDEVNLKDLDNPIKPSYLVSGLTDGNTYWFAITSISTSGNESALSSQTCITVNGQIKDCNHDDDDENGTTVYISCFIRTAGELFFQKP